MKKRVASIILIMTILCAAAGMTGAHAEMKLRPLGDADGDRSVTVVDATVIQRHVADITTLAGEDFTAADIDVSGELEVTDATFVQRWLADMEVPLNVNKPIYYYESEKNAAVDELSLRLAQTKAAAGNRPVMIRSYDTDSQVLAITAYTYDNALAAMAFISEGRVSDAEEILDAFVYAVSHDRYKPGRIRNAYASDTVYYYNGKDSVKLPGWWNYGASRWDEDPSQVGSNVGNTSYAALALLQYDRVYDTDKYLDTAKALMDWVLGDCTDSNLGFTFGYEGWPEEPNKAKKFTYKSTEHNIDAYVAFKQLYAVTGEEKYAQAAQNALDFVLSMYNEQKGLFYTGTTTNGVTPNTSVTALDAQVWAALALGEEFEPYAAALDTAASMKTPEGAYPFCKANKNGGFWCEGSAFTALTFGLYGDMAKYRETMDALSAVQLENGLFPAATVDDLDTGLWLSNGDPWTYCQDPHIAPAAWFIMAANGFNPYSF